MKRLLVEHQAAAEAKLTAALATLETCKATHTAAQAAVEKLTGERASWVSRGARKIVSDATAGRLPMPVAATDTAYLLREAQASGALEMAAQAVKDAQGAVTDARKAKDAADAAVRAEQRQEDQRVIRALDQERTALIRRVQLLTVMMATYELDSPGVVPSDISGRLNAMVYLPNLESSLQVSRHVVHDIDTPLGTRHSEIQAARAALERFTAELQQREGGLADGVQAA